MYVLQHRHELHVSITALYITDNTKLMNGSWRHLHKISGNLLSSEQANLQSIKNLFNSWRVALSSYTCSSICLTKRCFKSSDFAFVNDAIWINYITRLSWKYDIFVGKRDEKQVKWLWVYILKFVIVKTCTININILMYISKQQSFNAKTFSNPNFYGKTVKLNTKKPNGQFFKTQRTKADYHNYN